MNWNYMLNHAADVLLGASFFIVLLFGLWHGFRTKWWQLSLGVHTMTTTIVLLIILGLNGAQRILDLNLADNAPWIRFVSYALIFAWGAYRLLLFSHVRHTKPIGIFEHTWRLVAKRVKRERV